MYIVHVHRLLFCHFLLPVFITDRIEDKALTRGNLNLTALEPIMYPGDPVLLFLDRQFRGVKQCVGILIGIDGKDGIKARKIAG